MAAVDGSVGLGLGWVDIGRAFHGEVDGPYTWWSSRGKAFDNDTGWRIDYHLATAALADRASGYHVVRAPSWDTRWSDHAPVVVDYALGALSADPAAEERHPAPVESWSEQTPPVLRHAAVGRLPPDRQLHRGAHAVARPAGGLRRVLLRRRPARAHAAERPGRAAREDPPHRGPVHRGGHRARRSRRCTCSRTWPRTPSSPGSSPRSPGSARPGA